MKNVLYRKVWDLETKLEHVEPLPTTLIRETYNGKSAKYFITLKLRRDTTPSR